MTTDTPSILTVGHSRAGRTGSVTWMALPALVFFIGFGLIPLLGVLALSFTRWDGIGVIHPAGLRAGGCS